jgi:hypothetical protein
MLGSTWGVGVQLLTQSINRTGGGGFGKLSSDASSLQAAPPASCSSRCGSAFYYLWWTEVVVGIFAAEVPVGGVGGWDARGGRRVSHMGAYGALGGGGRAGARWKGDGTLAFVSLLASITVRIYEG